MVVFVMVFFSLVVFIMVMVRVIFIVIVFAIVVVIIYISSLSDKKSPFRSVKNPGIGTKKRKKIP